MCFPLTFFFKYYVTTSRAARYKHEENNFYSFMARFAKL